MREKDLDYKARVLDTKSDSFCGAKWYNATIWLGSGMTTSCHHPLPHKIDVEAVKKNPKALHNTPEKKEQRKQMKCGDRPKGCEYCWKIEDMGPKHVSDRIYKSKIYSDEDLQTAYDTPEDHINNSLYFEIKTFLPALFLVGDKLAMAHGLEERFPFMDNDLVEFAMKIPVKHKLGNLEKEVKKIDENNPRKKKLYKEYDDGKNVLRKAMSDFIPKSILERKKQGFSAPDESWYRLNNANYIRDILLNSKSSSSRYINKKFVERVVDEHLNKGINHRLLIWSLLNFEWWCRIFLK